MNELALFAGAGGGILGGHLLGWRTVCAVEWEPYAASVLVARQNDGILPPFPIWDDVQTFDGKPWRGIVDVVSGGFPCQDISAAGRGAGIEGTRSGLWREMARVVGEVRPRFVLVENSPMLTTRGGARVIADLASLGYDTQWDVMGAADVGAPHKRDRIWIVANSKHGGHSNKVNGINGKTVGISKENWQKWSGGRMSFGTSGMVGEGSADWLHNQGKLAYTNSAHGEGNQCTERSEQKRAFYGKSSWWKTEPDVGRVVDGVAARVDRLKAIGNGQVPGVAAAAFRMLGVA